MQQGSDGDGMYVDNTALHTDINNMQNLFHLPQQLTQPQLHYQVPLQNLSSQYSQNIHLQPQHSQTHYVQPVIYPSTSQMLPQYTTYENETHMHQTPPSIQVREREIISESSDSQDETILLENDFQQVRPRHKRKRPNTRNEEKAPKQKTTQNSFISQNIYEPLRNATEKVGGQSTSKTHANKEIIKIPPFILYGVTKNVQELLNYISKHAPNFTYKILYDDKIKVQVSTSEEYRNLRKKFETDNIVFHTFALPEEKTFRVVLRNIHHSTPLSDIKEALAEKGHHVIKIMNVHDRINKNPKNLFFIDLKRQQNNKDIYSVTKLINAIVKFEAPNKKTSIVQCKRCQNYGHTRNQCTQPFRCVKCAGYHDYRTCNKKREDGPAKCSLCGGDHPANYKKCQIYIEICKRRYPQRNGIALQQHNALSSHITHQNQINQTVVTDTMPPINNSSALSYAQVTRNQPQLSYIQPQAQTSDVQNASLLETVINLQKNNTRTTENYQQSLI